MTAEAAEAADDPGRLERREAWVAANVAAAPRIGTWGRSELAPLLDTSGQLPDASGRVRLLGNVRADSEQAVTWPADDNSVTSEVEGGAPGPGRGMSAEQRGSAP